MMTYPVWRNNDYCAPFACKIESLMRAAEYFSTINPELMNNILEFVKFDVRYLVSCFDGKRFQYGRNRIDWRMDYNQHSISALYLYKEFFRNKPISMVSLSDYSGVPGNMTISPSFGLNQDVYNKVRKRG